MKRLPILFISLLFVVTLGVNVKSQEIHAVISGTVKDAAGAVIPDSLVTVRNSDTGQEWKTNSRDDGSFRVATLLSGNYEVRVEASGFKTEIRRGITLAVGQQVVLNLALAVGERRETVIVTAAPPLVETSSSALSGVVDNKEMRDLPLNGRDFFQLSLLEPGVLPTTNAGPNPWAQGGITKGTANGVRPTFNNMSIDGADVNDPTYNIPPGGASGAFLGVEAIREFRILTNSMSAEYGRNAGAAINAVTMSGTNAFHGSVYEFVRNSVFDAKNYFDLPDEPIPHFSRNQFGFTFGGPIVKDRTFFFVNYEGLRDSLGRTATATVPNALAHQGFLPDPLNPGSLINVGVDPAVQPFLGLYPLPNGQDFGDGTALLSASASQPTHEDYFVVRIDHQFSENDTFFARYTFDDSDTENPFVSTFTPGFPSLQFRRNQFFALTEVHTFNPSTFNEFRFGFNRTFYGAEAARNTSGLSISAISPDQPLGLINIAGLSAVGNSILFPITSAGNTFQFVDNVSLIRGRHSLKVGGEFRRVQMNGIFDLFVGGNYGFNNLRDFLEGNPFSFFGALPGSNSARGFRQSEYAFFFQDDWRVSEALTLNLGFRYEYYTVPTEEHDRLVNIRDPLRDTVVTLGGPLYRAPKALVAPRLGFAWSPWRDGKTVVRGGFGIFYDRIWMNLYGNTRWSPPFYKTTFFLFPQFPNALAGAGLAIPVGLNFPIQFDLSQPYVLHYHLQVQRELPGRTVVKLGYVGTRGIHLPLQAAVNTPPPTTLPDGTLFFPAGAPRINPNFGPVSNILFIANSFYNALQVNLERQFHQGLRFQAAYTFSKSIDDASGPYPTDFTSEPGTVQNPFDRHSERSVSGFDRKHAFVLNFSYELPYGRGEKFGADASSVANAVFGGWSLSGITTLMTGHPFTVLVGFDRCQTIDAPCRPNLVPANVRTTGDPNQWFDPSGFSLQPAGFLGNAPRNVLRGPGLTNVDFAIRKLFPLGEQVRLEFRTEFFNIFNHPNFATPNNTRDPTGTGGSGDVVFADASGVPVGNAGKIFSTVTTSRQIQFALKLHF